MTYLQEVTKMSKQNWQQLVDGIGTEMRMRANPGRVDLAGAYADEDGKGRVSKGKSAVRGPNVYAEQSYSSEAHSKEAFVKSALGKVIMRAAGKAPTSWLGRTAQRVGGFADDVLGRTAGKANKAIGRSHKRLADSTKARNELLTSAEEATAGLSGKTLSKAQRGFEPMLKDQGKAIARHRNQIELGNQFLGAVPGRVRNARLMAAGGTGLVGVGAASALGLSDGIQQAGMQPKMAADAAAEAAPAPPVPEQAPVAVPPVEVPIPGPVDAQGQKPIMPGYGRISGITPNVGAQQ